MHLPYLLCNASYIFSNTHTPRSQSVRLCRPVVDDALQLPIIMGYAHPWSHTHIKNLGGLVLSIITRCLSCFYAHLNFLEREERKLCKIHRPSLWNSVLQRDRQSIRWGACRLWEKYVRVHGSHVAYVCMRPERAYVCWFCFPFSLNVWALSYSFCSRGGHSVKFSCSYEAFEIWREKKLIHRNNLFGVM